MTGIEQRLRPSLRTILVVALLLRVMAAFGLQYILDHHLHRDFLIEGDANGYWELATKLANGEEFAIHHPPRYALRMPGFPAVLAGSIVLLGENLLAARLVLAAVGTVAVYLTYQLGRAICDEQTGCWAATFAAIAPAFIGFTPIILGETCFAAALLGALLAGHRLKERIDQISATESKSIFGWATLTGSAIAIGVSMRPSWILSVPVVLLLLLLCCRIKKRALLAGLVVVAATFCILLPWGIRNQQVTGHFTLTTFWMGPSLYDGLNPTATGDSDMRFFDDEGLSRKMSEYEVDREYRHRAWEFVQANPVRTVELALAKAVRYWKPWPNAAQFDRLSLKILTSLFFVPLLLLSIWGGWTLKGDFWAIAILAGPILYFAAIHMVFVSSLRYRLPAEYPLAVLAAHGLQQCWKIQTPARSASE